MENDVIRIIRQRAAWRRLYEKSFERLIAEADRLLLIFEKEKKLLNYLISKTPEIKARPYDQYLFFRDREDCENSNHSFFCDVYYTDAMETLESLPYQLKDVERSIDSVDAIKENIKLTLDTYLYNPTPIGVDNKIEEYEKRLDKEISYINIARIGSYLEHVEKVMMHVREKEFPGYWYAWIKRRQWNRAREQVYEKNQELLNEFQKILQHW